VRERLHRLGPRPAAADFKLVLLSLLRSGVCSYHPIAAHPLGPAATPKRPACWSSVSSACAALSSPPTRTRTPEAPAVSCLSPCPCLAQGISALGVTKAACASFPLALRLEARSARSRPRGALARQSLLCAASRPGGRLSFTRQGKEPQGLVGPHVPPAPDAPRTREGVRDPRPPPLSAALARRPVPRLASTSPHPTTANGSSGNEPTQRASVGATSPGRGPAAWRGPRGPLRSARHGLRLDAQGGTVWPQEDKRLERPQAVHGTLVRLWTRAARVHREPALLGLLLAASTRRRRFRLDVGACSSAINDPRSR